MYMYRQELSVWPKWYHHIPWPRQENPQIAAVDLGGMGISAPMEPEPHLYGWTDGWMDGWMDVCIFTLRLKVWWRLRLPQNFNLCIYIYTYIYIVLYIHIYIYTYNTYIYIYIYTCTGIWYDMLWYILMSYIHACIHTYIDA